MLSRYLLLSAAHLLASVLGFIGVKIIVEHFGSAGLGQTSLALSLVGLALIVATGGTQLLAVRHLAAAPEDVPALAGNVIAIRLALASATYLVLMAVCAAVPPLAEILPLTALFALSLFVNAAHLSYVPQAFQQAGVLSAVQVATQGLYLLALTGLLAVRAGLGTVALSKVAADLVVAAALAGWVIVHYGRPRRPAATAQLCQLLTQAAPLAGTKLARALAQGSDLVVVSLFLDTAELGLYAGGVKIYLFLLSLATAYFVLLLPRLAERAERPGDALRNELAASLLRTVPPALGGVALLAVFARPLLVFLFDESFAAAVPVVRLLGLSFLVNVVGRHFRQVLLARGRQDEDLRRTLWAVGVHLVGKLVLTPLLGLVGAALGTLLGETVLTLALGFAARRELRATATASTASTPGLRSEALLVEDEPRSEP
ncbi:MAG: oligosaccharide flippase family protein [Thermoanaerobaculia bacterium]